MYIYVAGFISLHCCESMNVQVGILKLINFGNRELSVMYDTEQIWMVEFAYVYIILLVSFPYTVVSLWM